MNLRWWWPSLLEISTRIRRGNHT